MTQRGRRTLLPTALALAATTFACSPPDDTVTDYVGPRDDGGGETAADGDADADAETEVEVEAEAGPDISTDISCDDQDFPISMEPVRVMLLLDQSSSMSGSLPWAASHWDEATAGLNHLLSDPVSRNFIYGLDAFPDGTVEYFEECYDACCADPVCLMTQMMRCMAMAATCNRNCSIDLPPIVPLAPSVESGPAISAYMAYEFLPGSFTSTPLLRQMEWYRDSGPTAVPEFFDDEGASYIVVVSDGADTCDDTSDPPEPGPVIDGLAAATRTLLSTHGIKSFAIGFGDTSGSMADELNAVAANGGSPFTTFFPVDDPTALVEAFDRISSEIVSCIYDIEEPDATADPEAVNFYFDGEVVGFDDPCENGWHWTDDTHRQVEFCGTACEQLKDGEVESIGAVFGCATILW
jgi:hypothetical protein